MDSASPFAAILAGQPTLNRQLRMGMFAAPGQRIATRFTIKPMDLAESAACCPALKMPTIRALGMPMAGKHNAPPVGAAGRCGR